MRRNTEAWQQPLPVCACSSAASRKASTEGGRATDFIAMSLRLPT